MLKPIPNYEITFDTAPAGTDRYHFYCETDNAMTAEFGKAIPNYDAGADDECQCGGNGYGDHIPPCTKFYRCTIHPRCDGDHD